MSLEISCSCQQNELVLNGPVIMRFICHCLICQNVYKAPYADVVVAWKKDVSIKAQSIEFKKFRLPPALNRGICLQCQKPVYGYLKSYVKHDLAFILALNFKDPSSLPELSLHEFYHRAISPIEDGLPKYYGYAHSMFGLSKELIKQLLHRFNT
ncbi:GFA family protein [Acinetobacter oleivorans]|uniref:GFA family protein n=1 Tax=Acinetobacter oleivorans TaxID=1148157 RepID=A0ABR9NMY6_9GAMM|nr:GFA family protein [Acinetobacter oleivorans]MBE2166101.1 GFA family protein [Acinetobacter oleivorans]